MFPSHLFSELMSSNKDYKDISRDKLKEVIRKKLGKTGYLSISDGKEYASPTRKQILKFLKRDQTDKFVYKAETFDCDNFAIILLSRLYESQYVAGAKRSVTFGFLSGLIYKSRKLGEKTTDKDAKPEKHQMNFVVTSKGSLYLVEPQNDELYYPDPRNEYWVIYI